ncbi:MAG: ornithine carbamoyltransferase [Candidatus Heimdallarchaeota archaeon]|nr:ornithine carbamoyltransferase [Candidatus Heimdallarchaeota archaeon]MCK5182803.1 ornithine carbamoyltransferase [Candidatus Heimdallarchaeota archaeon]MCK5297896.1 ornithine carbamoyltransferase [Candidatus Heimdallarchaeota archaeon]
MNLKGRHLLTLFDYTPEEMIYLLDLGDELKKEFKKHGGHPDRKPLKKSLGMMFEKTSTRTRVSFETGIWELGGQPLFLSFRDTQLVGTGESTSDTGQVLSRYLGGIMARVFKHKTLTDLAEHSSIPIINGLCDLYHPCQILADLQTIREHKGKLKGLKLVYVGDGNNVAQSLMIGCTKMGMDVTIVCPDDYKPDSEITKKVAKIAEKMGTKLEITKDIPTGVKDADVIYTDTWISMGEEAQKEIRLKIFKEYTVDKKLMSYAKNDAIFLHCLPAHRGYEVTDEVIDSKQSIVFDEAENRKHSQKAVMLALMSD